MELPVLIIKLAVCYVLKNMAAVHEKMPSAVWIGFTVVHMVTAVWITKALVSKGLLE